MKEKIIVGFSFESYYGNGEFKEIKTVTKISNKSVWFNKQQRRESWNTVLNNFKNNLYRERR